MYEQLIDPLGQLHTLKGEKQDVGPGSDIVQITVVDISNGENNPSGSVQASLGAVPESPGFFQ